MASVVSIPTPIAGNPISQIQQIASNMAALRNATLKGNLVQTQTQLAPLNAAYKQSQAALANYKLAHPGFMASGGAQQAMLASDLADQGKGEEADAIRKYMQAQQNYRQNFANYYSQRSSNYIPNMFPANVRPFILDYMSKEGVLGKNFNELTPEQQQNITQIGRQAQNWTAMPATLKIGATIAPALESNVNQLEQQIRDLSSSGFVSGIPGWAQLGGAKLESLMGKDNPEGLQQYQTQVANIYGTAITSAKQLARLMGLQNTDQAAKAAQSILGSKTDFINNPMSMNLSKIQNLRQLMQNEVMALQGGGGPQALNRLSKMNLTQSPALGVSSAQPSRNASSPQTITVKSPNGSMHTIPKSQLDKFLQAKFTVVQ